MTVPPWSASGQNSERLRPVPDTADLDELEVLEDVDVLKDIEALYPEDDTLQEVAEQTPYGEVLLEDLVRRQLFLAISVAGVHLVVVFSLPLVNVLVPWLATIRLMGLPVTWLALAVLVYPFIWGLALYFVSTSKKYEDEFTDLVK